MVDDLTKAQRELLDLAGQGELEISNAHPEAIALENMGLLSIGGRILRGGGILFSRSAKITEAGRQFLATQSGGQS